jgi:hypothetical protein
VAVAVAVVVLVAATLLVVWWSRDGGSDPAGSAWHPAPQTLLASSMRVQPVPGWRASLTDLGVPVAPPGSGNQSRIATDDDPFESHPFVGHIAERAYFLASSPAVPARQWWLVGIDVRDGHRLFAPVALDIGAAAPDCFINGPIMVFCLRDDGDIRNTIRGGMAWVVDVERGAVTHTGPTDLRTYPSKLMVHQVGIYAIAETESQGVYGVGPQGETTWFVPGNGSIDQKYLDTGDGPPASIATQTTQGRGSNGVVAFSLSDGRVIRPELDENAQQQTTTVYPGGFAADIVLGDPLPKVQFFDDTGKRTSQRSVDGSLSNSLSNSGPGLPLVSLRGTDHWAVFAPDGGKLLEEPGQAPEESLLIGKRLFVRDYSDTVVLRWQQFDLQTGEQGKTCDHNMGAGYLGTDGTAALFASGNPNVGLVTTARDLTTCDTLWTLTSPVGSFRDVWRINTTLVQLSDAGTELTSLVAPG